MNKKTVSRIMLTLLSTGMLTLAFNIQPIRAEQMFSYDMAAEWDAYYPDGSLWFHADFLRFTAEIPYIIGWGGGGYTGPITEDWPVGEYKIEAEVHDYISHEIVRACSYFSLGTGEPPPHSNELGGPQPTVEVKTYIDYENNEEQRSFQVGDRVCIILWVGNFHHLVISATINIDPDTLNLESEGKWITAYIELPEGYDVNSVEVSTIKLSGEIPAEMHPAEIADYDEDGVSDLMVKFDRAEVMALLSVGEATLTITGEINDIIFEGSDTVRVIGE